MKRLISGFFLILLMFYGSADSKAVFSEEINKVKKQVIFVSFVANGNQVLDCLTLCESIRNFTGSFKQVLLDVYFPDYLTDIKEKYKARFSELDVKLKDIKIPKKALNYALGAKPFIAADAEKYADTEAEILVYLDPNIVFVNEPKEFMLQEKKVLAYRPVFHQNIGSLYSEEPDPFWRRLYEKLKVSESSLFPMEATADKKILRPYFNCGLLIVRPEKGILRKWAEHFKILYNDNVLAEMSKAGKYNVFIHQAALVSAILNNLKQEELEPLPESYNYPLFFEKFYESELQFDSIVDAVTLKCEFNINQVPEDWDKKIRGSKDIISWLKKKWSDKKK